MHTSLDMSIHLAMFETSDKRNSTPLRFTAGSYESTLVYEYAPTLRATRYAKRERTVSSTRAVPRRIMERSSRSSRYGSRKSAADTPGLKSLSPRAGSFWNARK